MTVDPIAALSGLAVPLGLTLLSFLWQGALIALLYGLFRRNLASPSARLLAGHLALLAFVAAPLLTFVSNIETGSGIPEPSVTAETLRFAAESGSSATAADAVVASVSTAWSGARLWLNLLVVGWALGVVGLSCRAWRQWRSLRRLCAGATPLEDQWQLRLQRLGKRLGIRRGVRLLQSAAVHAPVVVGWLRPAVLLPVGLIARMPPDQVEMLLMHELAHIRRADFLVNLVQIAIETLLFYHPAVHWVSRRIRDDRELCCDDWVTRDGGDRLRYARALLWLAEHENEDLRLRPALAVTGGVLLGRVERIVGPEQELQRERTRNRAWYSAAWVPLMLVVLMVAAGMRQASSPEQEVDEAVLAGLPELYGAAIAAPLSVVAVEDLTTLPRLRPLAPLLAARPAASRPTPPMAPLLRSAIDLDSAIPVASLALAVKDGIEPVDLTSPVATPPLALPAVSAEFHEGTTEIAPLAGDAPVYPYRARIRGVEGRVALSFEIDEQGKPVRIKDETGGDRQLTEAARRALQRWRYAPAHAASGRHHIEFDFLLDAPAQVATDALSEDECLPRLGSRICRSAQ